MGFFKKIFCTFFSHLILTTVLVNSSFAGEESLCWKKFNPGSWVLYELQEGLEKKITLATKTDAQISLKTEMIKDAAVISTSEEIIPLHLAREPAVAPKPGMREYVEDTLVVNQVIPCKVYEHNTKEGLQRTWLSEQIPGGLVQSTTGDTVAVKLIDYEAKYYLTK